MVHCGMLLCGHSRSSKIPHAKGLVPSPVVLLGGSEHAQKEILEPSSYSPILPHSPQPQPPSPPLFPPFSLSSFALSPYLPFYNPSLYLPLSSPSPFISFYISPSLSSLSFLPRFLPMRWGALFNQTLSPQPNTLTLLSCLPESPKT